MPLARGATAADAADYAAPPLMPLTRPPTAADAADYAATTADAVGLGRHHR